MSGFYELCTAPVSNAAKGTEVETLAAYIALIVVRLHTVGERMHSLQSVCLTRLLWCLISRDEVY